MRQIPQDFSRLDWRDVDGCMDKFVCDTGAMVCVKHNKKFILSTTNRHYI